MNGETIKSFLVGLGFGVDDASLAKFNKAIASASLKVTALYGSIKIAAAGIFYSISKISESFEDLGYQYKIIAPAINKALLLRQAMLSAYKAAGVNLVKVIQDSVKFNISLTKTKYALEAIYKSVGAKFLPLLTKQLDVFRTKIYANMPRIQAALEKFVTFIFKAFEATSLFGARVWSILGRIYDFFKLLDNATNGWSTKILAFIAVWKLLNLSFLKTPLGMILAGLTAIIALYDDFMVWKEGGESLIDWGSNFNRVLGIMVAIIAAIPALLALATGAMNLWAGAIAIANGIMVGFNAVMAAFRWVMIAVNIAMATNPVGLFILAFTALAGLATLVVFKWDVLKNWFSSFFSWASDKLSAFSNVIASVFGDVSEKFKGFSGDFSNLQGAIGPNLSQILQPQPLLAQNSSSSQRFDQETNIIVQASPNAAANGQAIASEQDRVNFDITRYLKTGAK